MQLLLDVRGYSYIPDAAFAEVQAAVTRITEIAAAAGYPLRADCVGTHPDTPPEPVAVTSLTPATAVCGGPDLTLHVRGTGFTPSTVILFNQLEEPTVFVSASDVTTGVKPLLFVVPAVCPVSVVGASTSVDFTFTAATRAAAPAKP